MNINNPIEVDIAKPYGLDVRLGEMQTILRSNLTWLEKLFGRAVALYGQAPDGTRQRIPKVPIGGGEYFNVMPNDALRAFGFFYPKNPLTPQEATQPYQKSQFFQQPVDLIIWCNLDQIEEGNLGLSEQLKADVIKQLQKIPFAVVETIYSDDVREVYDGWDLDIQQRDLLVYPFYAMRFNLLITIENEC